MQLIKWMAALGLTVALSASATSVSLSGIVKDSVTGNGLSGAKVSLAKAGLSPTTTLSDGSWTLSGVVTGIAGRHSTAAVSGTSHLSVQDGHALLRYEGHDLLGHSQPVASAATASATALARSSNVASDTIDTLLFSWQGTVRLRKPITSYEQNEITTILDTSSTSSAVTGDSGHFTDSRDGQSYKYVKIGTQTWMAQNLNYKVDSSWCYGGVASNCSTYGRLYRWSSAMALSSHYDSSTWGGTLPHQGICPSGWHVPSDAEWNSLIQYVGFAAAETELKANSALWRANTNTGTDVYGFSVLPAGIRFDVGTFNSLGYDACFWSSSEYAASNAWNRDFDYDYYGYVDRNYYDKFYGFSLRCAQN